MKEEEKQNTNEKLGDLIKLFFSEEELKEMEEKYNQLLKEREEKPTHNVD